MNLLDETLDDIRASGHSPEDIIFIGSRATGHQCTWAEFVELANKDYDNGFGAQQVARDLEIAFADGSTMRRHEYDGSEYWSYSTPFALPDERRSIQSLFVPSEDIGWETLGDINGEEES